ncbi:IS3 family transposase [Klebsiella michiganensis]|nr:IS3 family transposase [Klebsiella michiganensis]
MYFVSYNIFNGRPIWALIVVDNFSQEYLMRHGEKFLREEDVVRVMEAL